MSRNQCKIEKALNRKGYQSSILTWAPIGGCAEMCGPDGGWYVEVEVKPDMKPMGRYHGTILGYNTDEVLEEIAKLPDCVLDEENCRKDA